jgi:hypothetical protein
VNQSLRLVVLKEVPEDEKLRHQWNALLARIEQPQVFYTYEWALAVYRAYHASLNPLIFLGYDDAGELCGVAALAKDARRGRVSFLCATTGDYCDFISLREHKAAFVGAVLAELAKDGLGEVTLTNLPADSDTMDCIRQAAGESGYHCFARTAYVCAQVSLSHLERLPGDNKPVLPRKKMLRRFLNAMGKEAPVRLDHASSWETIQPVLPEFMQCHIARFLMTGRISNMARPERRKFLEEAAKLLSGQNWLRLTRMMSGKNAYAWNYGFQFGSTWFWYQPTFDSDLEKYSPGFCLLAKLIEEAVDDPTLKIVDLGLGAEEYKDRFSNQSRETLYVTLRSARTRHAREVLRYRAARLIQSSPKLESVTRGLVARLGQLKERVAGDGAFALPRMAAARAGGFLWSRTEVRFYEGRTSDVADAEEIEVPALSVQKSEGQGRGTRSGAKLIPLDLNQLATAVSQYYHDKSTLAYLLRAASRLREEQVEGYGLADAEGRFVHFAWVTAFDKFQLAELQAKVDAPGENCVMLFDCWTPKAARGHGYYGKTVARIANMVIVKGKRPWIFSAASNIASEHGLGKTSFQYRYSLVRQRILGMQTVKGNAAGFEKPPSSEVSARV